MPGAEAVHHTRSHERTFGKLKNWKRIAIHYDGLATNDLVALATQWAQMSP